MSCNTCFQSSNLPRCIDEIIIGAVAANLPVKVYFTSPGNNYEVEITSGVDGKITIDTSAVEFMNTTYKIEVFSQADPSIPLNITMANGEVVECIELRFTDGSADSGILQPKN